MVLSAAAAAAGDPPAQTPTPAPTATAEATNGRPAARRALEAWRTATDAPAQLAALKALADLSTTFPLVLAPLITAEPPADASVRARWITIVSQSGLPESLEPARQGLSDPDEAVAVAAAAALGQSASSMARESLLGLFRQSPPPPPAAAVAASRALAATATTAELAALQTDPEPGVRRAALSALRHQASPRCASFLATPDLADEAAAAIYDDRLEGAWPALIDAGLHDNSPLTAPGRQRAIAAAWYEGSVAAADQLAAWLTAQPPVPGTTPAEAATRLAWHALLSWDTPPADDPVVAGRPFHARPRPHARAWDALRRHSRALAAWSTALDGQAPATWKAWQSHLARAPRAASEFTAFLADATHPDGERLHHFRSRLASTNDPAALMELAGAALAAPDAPALRTEARTWLFRRRGTDAVPWLLQSLTDADATEKQAAIRLLDQATRGLVDPAVLPEIVEAAERRTRAEGPDSRTERASLDAWRASQAAGLGDPLRPWRAALSPGDADAGRTLFFSEAAGCARCHRAVPDPAPPAPALGGVGSRLSGAALLEVVLRPVRPEARRPPPSPDGGCRPAGSLFSLRELRDLLAFLRSLP